MDISEDIGFQFVIRARLHDDEASIILKGHLLSEFLLNRIITRKIPSSVRPERITYSQKLKLLEKHGLLTDYIVNNLRLLNGFRNRMVHELDASIGDHEMLFHKSSNDVLIVRPKKSRHPKRRYLRLLSHGVLNQLFNHMLLNLKVDPRWTDEHT